MFIYYNNNFCNDFDVLTVADVMLSEIVFFIKDTCSAILYYVHLVSGQALNFKL